MIHDALVLLDAFLADTANQSLIDADRVRDLLLDVRSALTSPNATTWAERCG